MSITSITIENFKGIRDKVKIDLKPITLLFGPNSAGKSTIIQALHYAWEVIGRHNLDPNFTEFGGREMDLGGFENLVYGHDLSRSISIRLDMDLMGKSLPIYGDSEELAYAQLEFVRDMADDDMKDGRVHMFRWHIGNNEILNAWVEFQVSWSESTERFQVSSYEVGLNNEMIAKIKIALDSGKVNITYINFFHPLLTMNNERFLSDCDWLNNLISAIAKKPNIGLDKKVFSSEQYNRFVEIGNIIKEFSSLKEKLAPYSEQFPKKNIAFKNMTDKELRMKLKRYGHKNTKDMPRHMLLHLFEIETIYSLEKMTNDDLRRMIEPLFYEKNDEVFHRDVLVAFFEVMKHMELEKHYAEKIEHYAEKAKRYDEMVERYDEMIEQLALSRYEFLFFCIEAFGIQSIQEDLNIECLGLIDALPRTDVDFKLDFKSKSSDNLLKKIDYSDALDSAIEQFTKGPLEVLRDELQKLSYLGPIRSRIPRNYVPNRYVEKRNWPDGLAAWDVLHKNEDAEIVKQTDFWMADSLKSGYHIIRKTYKEIDASQIAPEQDNILALYNSAPAKTRLYLIDQKNGVEVQPPDVGVGISQVIPVIVSALYFKEGIVSIEQPELHIHPALQVTLGDLFISQIQEQGPCFILETHSEHMLLRLLRRIRETHENKLPDGISGLSPDQLIIHYIESGPDGVKISTLEIDETGEFKDEWLHGFFEEREEELFY